MNSTTIKTLFFLVFMLTQACIQSNKSELLDYDTWQLEWRMIENAWDDNYRLAEIQFDSLLSSNKQIDAVFLINGLETKLKLSKEAEVIKIIESQSIEILNEICEQQFAKGLKPCINYPIGKVETEKLKLEIIKLYVADQAIRGNLMTDIIRKYKIDSTKIKTDYDRSNPDEINIDEVNRNQLKRIFKDFGFPTRKLIGKQAMHGIFLIIQHADGDPEWQKSLLQNVESAAINGDLEKKNYAYLYDRIMVNSGQPQKYGSQFQNVDRMNQIVELRETEDLANLDQRRREMGMMPIEMYKRLILKN